MRIKRCVLPGFGLLVGGIVVALAVIAFLLRTFSVSRGVTIDGSANEVFDYLKNLCNQPEFSIWSQLDPKIDKSVSRHRRCREQCLCLEQR